MTAATRSWTVDDLATVLPPHTVDTGLVALQSVSSDTSGWSDGRGPAAVVHPESVTQVQALLRWAHGRRVPLVPRGAGTGLTGAAAGTDGSIVVVTDRLDRILEIAPEDGVAVVEPGVVTADLDAAARTHGLFYAPDPASHRRSTIGGNIATNAGGLHCVKYGVTRESVLALDVVLPGGELLHTGQRSIKGVTGFDLTSLFVGSEGLLGVVVRAILRLRPVPVATATLVGVFPDTPAAARAVAALAVAPVTPSVLELLGETAVARLRRRSALEVLRAGDVLLLVQTDGFGAHEEAAEVARVLTTAGGTVRVASDAAEAEELLDLRRTWGEDPTRRFLVGEDVAVPRSRLAELVTRIAQIGDRHGLGHTLAAHAGDGNLHPGFDVAVDDPRSAEELAWAAHAAADDLVRAALALGGTLTGEHGIGVLKRPWFEDEVGALSAGLQRSLKAVFDPHGILNPGKVFEDREFVAAWQAWHTAHEAALASPHGFLAVTALHWLTDEPQRFEGVPGTWTSDERGVVVRLADGEELTLDGEALSGTHIVGHLPERGGVLAAYGDTVLEIARRGGHDILRPRHPDHPLRRQFRGTPAYPPHPRWVVQGRYVAFDEPRPTRVGAVVDGLEHVYDAPGKVEFTLDGEPLALTTFAGPHGGLIALFTDATSGRTTYAANRALAVPAPDADGHVVLDLNRATNLPCAYTDLATCPLPPAENHLSVAVEAGEQIPYERR